MNKLIFFGAGLIVGAGIGVLSVRGHYRKLAFDEINEARDVFRKMTASKEAALRNTEKKDQILNDISGKTATTATKESDENEKSPKKTGKTATFDAAVEAVKKYSGKDIGDLKGIEEHFNVFTNRPSMEKLDILGDDEDDENEIFSEDPYELVVDRTAPSDGYSEPYEITEDEFASEKLFYDKVMIEYYNDGIAILEDSDQIVESIEELIGPDILEDVSNRYENSNEIYVRNDSRSTDYGIIFTGTDFVPEEGLS